MAGSKVFDGDILALRGWINREGVIPLSGQAELREAVSRVLCKLSTCEGENERLRAIVDKVPQCDRCHKSIVWKRRDDPVPGIELLCHECWDASQAAEAEGDKTLS